VAERRDRRAHGFTHSFGISRPDARQAVRPPPPTGQPVVAAFEALRSVSGGGRPTAPVGPKIDLEPNRM
jgi:hypothetical protein